MHGTTAVCGMSLHNLGASYKLSYLGVTLENFTYGVVPQHDYQHQPNKIKQHPKEIQVEVLYVDASVHVLL